MTETNAATTQTPKPKLSTLQQVVCAWPLALVIIGGLIGGACGGAAWAVNTRIMASNMAAPVRYGLIVLTGVVAIGAYFVFASLFLSAMAPH